MENTVFKDFAAIYIHQFTEMMAIGCEGGLYGEVVKPNNGIFSFDDIKKFIRFQHGDNDFHYNFSPRESSLLADNPLDLCKALLYCLSNYEDYYTKAFPNLLRNIKDSLEKIIKEATNV